MSAIIQSPMSVDWSSPVNWAHPLNRGLVSWWLAAPGGTGFGSSTWRDLTRRNNGTLTNMDPATDWLGPHGRPGGFGALDFDGVNDYVDTGSSNESQYDLAQFTLSMWVVADSVGNVSYSQGAIGKESGSASDGYAFGKYNGKWILFVSGSNVQSSTGFETGVWKHIVGTYDGTNMQMYVDGLSASAPTGSSAMVNNNDPLTIGRWVREGHADRHWDGLIDDARIYNRALSANEVPDLYRRSKGYQRGLLNRRVRFRGQPQAAAGSILPYINSAYFQGCLR